MAFRIDGRRLSPEEFRAHVAQTSFASWRPSGIAVHNTANPSLYPTGKKGQGSWKGSSIAPAQRVKNLASYYSGLGWRSGPHLFIDDDGIWLFTPINQPGTHSPSWNGTKIGIEMVGDYDIEKFDEGPGAKVRANTVAALAILHARLGLDPNTIKLHKEDPRTTHACPGKNVMKADLIRRVINYMGDGGDHSTHDDIGAPPPAPVTPAAPAPSASPAPLERAGVVTVSDLALRSAASSSADKMGSLPRETVLTVIGEAMNGDTLWLRIKTPAGYTGWVAGRYVKVGGPKKPKVTRQFIVEQMQAHGWSAFVGYGAASNAYQESSFDPDAVGDGGRAYGLFQWHGDRQAAFRAVFGKDIRDATAGEQIDFVDWELRNSEVGAGNALKNAKSANEAGALFSRFYERPKAADLEAKNRGARAQEWFDTDKA